MLCLGRCPNEEHCSRSAIELDVGTAESITFVRRSARLLSGENCRTAWKRPRLRDGWLQFWQQMLPDTADLWPPTRKALCKR